MDRRSFALSILSAVCFLSATKARTLDRQQVTPSSTPSTGQLESQCGFNGTSDMYGLGIRLGVYLQTFALLLARAFDITESMEAISFSGCFFKLSMLTGLSVITIASPKFNVVEAGIVVAFTLCTHEAVDFNNETTKPSRWGFIKGLLPILVLSSQIGLSAYSIWFWFRGIDWLAHSACPSYGFFFARVTYFGWFRIFGKIFTIFQFLLLIVLSIYVVGRKMERLKPPKMPQDHKTTTVVRKIIPWAWSFLCILAIELMIRWNHIDGVNSISSVGQVIPFFVGFGSVVTVAIEWEKSLRDPPPKPSARGHGHEFVQEFVQVIVVAVTAIASAMAVLIAAVGVGVAILIGLGIVAGVLAAIGYALYAIFR
ncbi:hypothetical protein K440DRAFT_662314 [Wilcoxina mikolae CBS 423.85]|nr:hypothetical protein K440DRAFT_662314 [Wilcoxina mikolae CBS 423.85]